MHRLSETKQKAYEALVHDVRQCRLCDGYTATSPKGTVTLQHDSNRRHINLWSEWQNSLDADILLIGQDWGNATEAMARATEKRIDDGFHYLENQDIVYPTDKNLIALFQNALNMDILQPSSRLFFTNSIQCYKTGSLSNKTHDKWFTLCNQNYMGRLIQIIQPKMIIPIGKLPTLGLMECGHFTDLTGKALTKKDFATYREVLDRGVIALHMAALEQSIYVRPVSHTGVLATNMNRSAEEQLKDWLSIRPYLD